MKNLRKIFLAAAVVMSLVIFTGCFKREDKTKYLHLQTDIIGAWCDEFGPELVKTEAGTAYRFYEFTESGMVIRYFAYEGMGAVYLDEEYSIDGNLFSSGGGMCRINVENDILTMTYDEGSSRYRRVGAAELLEYSVYAQGEALYAEQEPLIMAQQDSGIDMGSAADFFDLDIDPSELGGIVDTVNTGENTDNGGEAAAE